MRQSYLSRSGWEHRNWVRSLKCSDVCSSLGEDSLEGTWKQIQMVSLESWTGPGFLEDLCLWLMITGLQNRKGDTVRGRHFTQLQGSQNWSQFLLCYSSKELGYTGKQTSKPQPWSHINKNTKIHLVFLIICDPTESRPVYFSEQHGRRESGNNSDMYSLFIPVLNILASAIWIYSTSIILIIFPKIPLSIISYINGKIHCQLEFVVLEVKLS